MPATKALTEYRLKAIRSSPPATGRVEHWDTEPHGLGVRVSSSGSMSWVYVGRVRGDPRPRRFTLGSYPYVSLAKAREEACRKRDQLRAGVDPKVVAQAAGEAARVEHDAKVRNSYGAVRDRFLKAKAPLTAGAEAEGAKRGGKRLKGSTHDEYSRVLKGADFAKWENRPIAEITRADVRQVIDGIEERISHIAANKAFSFVRAMFNWAVDRDLLEIAPTASMKPPEKAEARDRVLTDDELRVMWRRVAPMPGPFSPLVRLLALTGQRREEIAGLRWEEIFSLDTEAAYIELPKERTKNKLPHIVPLAPAAAQILREAAATLSFGGSPFVFTTTGVSPVSGFSKVKIQIDRSIVAFKAFGAKQLRERGDQKGAEAIERTFPEVPGPLGEDGLPKGPVRLDWRLHDLRRTLVTGMNAKGIPPHVVEAVVNHVSGVAKAGVAGTYNRALYLPERRAALEMWARHVEQLASGKPADGKVVALAAKRSA